MASQTIACCQYYCVLSLWAALARTRHGTLRPCDSYHVYQAVSFALLAVLVRSRHPICHMAIMYLSSSFRFRPTLECRAAGMVVSNSNNGPQTSAFGTEPDRSEWSKASDNGRASDSRSHSTTGSPRVCL